MDENEAVRSSRTGVLDQEITMTVLGSPTIMAKCEQVFFQQKIDLYKEDDEKSPRAVYFFLRALVRLI